MWKLKDETKIVLTTADVVGNCYKKTELRNFFVKQVFMPNNGAIYENLYHHPIEPFLNHSIGEGILFSREWGCLLVDEIKNIPILIQIGVKVLERFVQNNAGVYPELSLMNRK